MDIVEIILWVLQFALGFGVIFLVLIHSGRGGGLSDMFGGGLGASAAAGASEETAAVALGEPVAEHGAGFQPHEQCFSGQHVAQVLRQDRFFLCRWPCVLAADAGQHGGDVPVLAVQPFSALRIAPG